MGKTADGIAVDFRAAVGTTALSVSFDAPGGIVVLFGPSGCGKTSTLNCIAGLMAPSAGVIEIGSQIYFDSSRKINLPTRERGVGYVFQEAALFPHLTVLENIRFGIDRWTPGEQQTRLQYLSTILGLEELKIRKPSSLSGGQAQRVALARALAPKPRLMLLDEPFNALDIEARRQLGAELRRIHEITGIPMIFVTHWPDEADLLGDIIVHMENGKVTSAVRGKMK
ncbi:MAG TPA: ATP-binding cassette domain-containing protein [Chroococcales cyanobacterium]